jgi:hypothetical protein
LCTAATAYAGTAASLRAYLAYQLGMAAALLGSAMLLWRVAPNVERARWQNTVQVALFALAAAAAGANVALRYALERGGAGALVLCAALLAATGAVTALLLVQWWRALVTLGAQLALTARGGAHGGGGGALGRGAGGMVVRDPRYRPPPPAEPPPPADFSHQAWGEGVTTVTWNNFWGKSRAVEQLERGGWGLRRGGGAADKLHRGSRGGRHELELDAEPIGVVKE